MLLFLNMVKQKYFAAPFIPDPFTRLIREKDRIEKQIRSLQEKVEEIDRRLDEYGKKEKGGRNPVILKF